MAADEFTGAANQPGEYESPLAPTPMYAERDPTHYERKMAPNAGFQQGPLRFEEGVATDTDVPADFEVGVMQGHAVDPRNPNDNQKVDTKWPEETVQQRAHVGSAAWTQAPTFLDNFVEGSFVDSENVTYAQVVRDGRSYRRANPADVID